uniref:Putative endonuclease/reverse transcript n=1 Tax=Ixodes ricinus TaxID=34613 RepID=A0A6B0UYP8_IXORI
MVSFSTTVALEVLHKNHILPTMQLPFFLSSGAHAVISYFTSPCRFILSNYSHTTSVSSMKSTLELPGLTLCRKYFHFCLFRKTFYANPILKDQLLFHASNISPRSNHECKVGMPTCDMNIYFDSFIPRTSNDWNHLPASIVSIHDATYFKMPTISSVSSTPPWRASKP